MKRLETGERVRKRRGTLPAVLCGSLLAGALTACSLTPGASGQGSAAQTGSGVAADSAMDTVINICLVPEENMLDPALNTSKAGGTLLVQLYSGLAKWQRNADGVMEAVPDAAVELPEGVRNEDGTVTYTYTLRDGLKWTDGQAVLSGDFIYAWNRAASVELGAHYGYLFDVIDGYDAYTAVGGDGARLDPEAKLNLRAPDEKTLVVTLAEPVPGWEELLAFPAFFPVREDIVTQEGWMESTDGYVGNGAYRIAARPRDNVLQLVKDQSYAEAADVSVGQINCFFTEDAHEMLRGFQNGLWQMVDEVPGYRIRALRMQYPEVLYFRGSMGSTYLYWDANAEFLPAASEYAGDAHAEQEIRQALAMLPDRGHIVDNIAKGGEIPAYSIVAYGVTDADGSQFCGNGSESAYTGDFDTVAYQEGFDRAVGILKKYYEYDRETGIFTDFPTVTYLYGVEDRQLGMYLQDVMADAGITVKLQSAKEWDGSEESIVLRSGRQQADYDDPFCFLEQWVTAADGNVVHFGKEWDHYKRVYDLDLTGYGIPIAVVDGNWQETYDALIGEIRNCRVREQRYAMMHLAEDMLMETGYIMPLYFDTDSYMLAEDLEGVYSDPMGYKYFMHGTIKETDAPAEGVSDEKQ
ncbi:MAG: hypothetical protein IJ600_09800 [Lachnospiraceae bacterium]|nr:hypothetical protein [Lachnospiraceae bacterium]